MRKVGYRTCGEAGRHTGLQKGGPCTGATAPVPVWGQGIFCAQGKVAELWLPTRELLLEAKWWWQVSSISYGSKSLSPPAASGTQPFPQLSTMHQFCCHQERSKMASMVPKEMASKQDPAQSTTQSLSSGSKTQSVLWVFGLSAQLFVKLETAHPAIKC